MRVVEEFPRFADVDYLSGIHEDDAIGDLPREGLTTLC
jgi:hypothetical protein